MACNILNWSITCLRSYKCINATTKMKINLATMGGITVITQYVCQLTYIIAQFCPMWMDCYKTWNCDTQIRRLWWILDWLLEYIYVTVQYDMWLKCILWGNVFPPTLGEQCGWGVCLCVHKWSNRTEELSSLSLPPRISATQCCWSMQFVMHVGTPTLSTIICVKAVLNILICSPLSPHISNHNTRGGTLLIVSRLQLIVLSHSKMRKCCDPGVWSTKSAGIKINIVAYITSQHK